MLVDLEKISPDQFICWLECLIDIVDKAPDKNQWAKIKEKIKLLRLNQEVFKYKPK